MLRDGSGKQFHVQDFVKCRFANEYAFSSKDTKYIPIEIKAIVTVTGTRSWAFVP